LARPGTGSPAGLGRAHRWRRSQLRGPGYFKRLGPGIVTGAADDDPSGIGTYSQVGAAFGFGLLWTTLATLPLAVAVQEATARLGLVTGKGLAALLRERFPRPVLLGAVMLVAVANTFNIGADIASMAAAARLLVPVPQILAAVAFALVMIVLEVTVRYHRYARVLRWLALSLLAYVGVLAVVHVDWTAVLAHTLVPSFQLERTTVAALLAVFGTTISPTCSSGRPARRSRRRPSTTTRWTAGTWRRCGWTSRPGWARAWG
jgi:NRAMP (natural resistance-associated macrophage protein)-like metal ion transporter